MTFHKSPQQHALEQTRQHLEAFKKMSKEKKLEFLIESGILSRTQEVTTRYGGHAQQDKEAMARAREQGRYVY